MFPVGSSSAIWLIGSGVRVMRTVAIVGAENPLRRTGGI
jgi:hypothetical protein